jgi:uncharacterized protein YodC (DUF2158 family)
MANGEFKVGDVVQLKSGGPKMTIGRFEDIDRTMHAVCAWFIGNKREIGTFPLTSLEHAA